MPFWSRKPAPAVDETNSSSGANDVSLSPDISASFDATSAQQGTGVGVGDGVLLSSPSPRPQLSIPDNTLNGDNGSTSENVNATVSTSSEAWTKIFPEAFGVRQSIEDSSFRWCVRESMLWGVATGTMMGIHRLRMKSTPFFAINIAFGTTLLVAAPSYFFCYRKREHQEKVIEMMMAANDFRPGEEMPETVPMDKDHPFLDVRDGNENDNGDRDLQKEFVARLKEKKEWQEPHQTQDADEVFKEVKKGGR